MRVLLDSDVILDLVLDRKPFVEQTAELFKLHEQGEIDGYISSITPVNVFYLTRKFKGIDAAKQAVQLLLSSLNVCPLDQTVLENAQELGFKDYEDAVQCASAAGSRLEAIITRNVKDYKKAVLPIFTPADFLDHLRSAEA